MNDVFHKSKSACTMMIPKGCSIYINNRPKHNIQKKVTKRSKFKKIDAEFFYSRM